MKMNISVLMCMLVVLAVNAQSGTEMQTETEIAPTVEKFQAFLEKAKEKFVELAESDGCMAISSVGIALGESLMFADKLVKAKLLTKMAAVKKIVENVKDGLSKTLHIGPIKLWAKAVCAAKELPFPAAAIDMFPNYRNKLNLKLNILCKALELKYGKE